MATSLGFTRTIPFWRSRRHTSRSACNVSAFSADGSVRPGVHGGVRLTEREAENLPVMSGLGSLIV